MARHFDGLVWKGLGLEKYPELRDMYFGNYTHLLYLKQIDAQDETERAKAAADRLGLTYIEADAGLEVLEKRILDTIEQSGSNNRRTGELI